MHCGQITHIDLLVLIIVIHVCDIVDEDRALLFPPPGIVL